MEVQGLIRLVGDVLMEFSGRQQQPVQRVCSRRMGSLKQKPERGAGMQPENRVSSSSIENSPRRVKPRA
jgi:hypothetical protein